MICIVNAPEMRPSSSGGESRAEMARAGKDEMRRGTEPPASAPSRRGFFKLGGAAALALGMPLAPLARAAEHRGTEPHTVPPSAGAADYTIRIGTGLVELGPDTTISTKTYNRRFPGPLLRLTEGKRVVVDVHNDTDTPEQLHWHGQFVPVDVDGAAEEGTPYIPAYGMRRIAFTPGPAGLRFYHSHLAAGSDLYARSLQRSGGARLYRAAARARRLRPRGVSDAQGVRAVSVAHGDAERLPRRRRPRSPNCARRRRQAMLAALKEGRKEGYELAYNYFSINGRMLGHGEPIRVRTGERVLFHVLNASASEIRAAWLCRGMPSKSWRLTATRCRTRRRCRCYGSARPSAFPPIVEMAQPGIWVLGELIDEDRGRGMGIVVEYAGAKGGPQWRKPAALPLGLSAFRRIARGPRAARRIDRDDLRRPHRSARRIRRVYDQRHPVLDGKDGAAVPPASAARRYRLRLRNATDDIHPIHLHRHSFEITGIAGTVTAGVIKDVAMLGRFQEMTIDFTADQPGRSLFHCHMQPHMDFGFMALFDCG